MKSITRSNLITVLVLGVCLGYFLLGVALEGDKPVEPTVRWEVTSDESGVLPPIVEVERDGEKILSIDISAGPGVPIRIDGKLIKSSCLEQGSIER